MNFLIRGLWIEYEMRKFQRPNADADTVIQFSPEEETLYYDRKPLTDSLVSLEPKYAEKAAAFFELRTGLKRNKIHRALNLIPVLDKQLIKNWTTWYRRNRSQVKWEELDLIVH